MASAHGAGPGPIDGVEELTAEWLTAALQSAGHDLTARTVTATPIGVGQIGANLRLVVDWVGTPGPATLVAKLAAGDPDSRDIVKLAYVKEVGFYLHLAERTSVRAPTCWFGAANADSSKFTLLLDDLAPAVPGDQLAGCDETAAAAALENLAGMHASWWCDPTLADNTWLTVGGLDDTTILGPIMVDAVPKFAAKLGHRLSTEDIEVLHLAAEATEAWATTRTERFGLVHADYRLDNLMFGADGEVTTLDWQTLSIAPVMRDVAYFCETCLDPELRRQSEHGLVQVYLDTLRRAGVAEYTDDDAWIDYRLGTVHGALVTVLGCVYAQAEPGERSDAMFTAMATRTCAAIRDLDPFELLG